MSIVNRRNAVVGWGVLKIGKRFARQKARAAVPGPGDHAGLNKSAIGAILATAGGVILFWRKKSGSEPE